MMTVWCSVEFPAIHCWPDALGDVEYLKFPHRHIFKVVLTVGVASLNRQVEFITLKKELLEFCLHAFPDKMYKDQPSASQCSCEMMCSVIAEWAARQQYYPTTVSVSEDGENGATWYRD